MIEQNANVIRVEGEIAWLQVQRESTCGSCGVRKGCGTNTFSKVLGNRFSEIKALNKLDLKPGDNVTIALHESTLLKSALLMYMLPLVTMFLSAILGSWATQILSGQSNQAIIILFALSGLLFSFLFIKRFMKRHAASERFQPVVVRKNIMCSN